MAILQDLREKAGPLLAIVIGISLLLFIVSDFFGSNTSQRRKANKYYQLATIDGESVSYQEFEARVQDLADIYKMSGSTEINEEMMQSLREQVWQQMLSEKLMGKTYRQVGLGVSPDEVEMLVFGDDRHPIVRQLFTDPGTGTFNESFLVNFLKATETDDATKKYWLFFEDQIINDRLNTKLVNLMSKGLYVTGKQSEYENSLHENTVSFSYMVRNYASIPDSLVKVTSDEIRSYYDKHKDQFKRGASRDIEYITFEIAPSEEDIKETETWAVNEKENFAAATEVIQYINLTADTRYTGSYLTMDDLPESLRPLAETGDKTTVLGPYLEDETFKLARIIDIADRPDSVRAAHILLSPNANRTLAQARKEADSLIALVRSGIDFNLLAMANSDDQGSAQVGGDLGWFSEGMMVIPFNNACFSNKKGDIVTAETTYGIHIIKIIDQSRRVRKYDIGIVDRQIIPGSMTTQRIYSDASYFAGNNETYEKFNKAVAEGNLNKKLALNVTPDQKELPGLTQSRELVMALFQNSKAGSIITDNSNQAVFELPDQYVVAYCSRAQEEGVAPVEDVASEIRFILAKKKKAEIIAAEMKKLEAEGKSLNEIAAHYNTTVQDASGINFRSYSIPGAGIEPALISAASASEAGKLSKPVEGNNGVYMFMVSEVTPVAAEDLEMVKERMNSSYQIRASYEAYQALRDKNEVKDMRYKFY
ncbi:MAG TPA: peptidylprolyl isomerase [Bacteroidales bacterium]|jgi:peptidyl-prolyl cis-trans isomerase D|nr:peptidylprolyl isomerase [Bacteroidales bacterium]MDI9532628.1 peptidylprolyl isomerase [Bacteroidota bacterium]OPZ57766.1 MAG: putative peptidyl-prolyl cis-trans isomerase Cbf2 precursor [Bacteroidetes bacterium ADurb.BinA012]MBK7732066.1 peptidylprolyl isomerase [Bacteroidales bacterium]MBP7036535.1 peptidylprolyl isomerase [Bacteroidales bacterium]